MGMKEQPLMMDVQVTDVGKWMDFMELRLGLHTITMPETDRLVGYYKCVRDYMKAHASDKDNQLLASYSVSPLATSREMLKWRDALAVCGWTKDSPAPSSRLRVLQGVEQIFAEKCYPDASIRQKAIIERLKQKKGMMNDVTFVMPFDVNLLHPVLKEMFLLAQADGARIERLVTPAIEGTNNLARLKHLLTAENADFINLEPTDDSVRIWNFKDEMEAEEYLAMMDDDTFDVSINPDAKLADNFLHMMGKPVTGSSVANSAPQIIQLFFTGVAIWARPLNIDALLQWLYAPIHPLPGSFRYRLAERLARTGGWLPETTEEGADNCYQLVKGWIEGRYEAEHGQPIDKKEQESRAVRASVFLPGFDDGNEAENVLEDILCQDRQETVYKDGCQQQVMVDAVEGAGRIQGGDQDGHDQDQAESPDRPAPAPAAGQMLRRGRDQDGKEHDVDRQGGPALTVPAGQAAPEKFEQLDKGRIVAVELQVGDRLTVEFSGPYHLLDHDAPVRKFIPKGKGTAQVHDKEEQDHPEESRKSWRQEEPEPLGPPYKGIDQQGRASAGQQRQQDQPGGKGARQELAEKEYIDRREQSHGSARSEFMSGDHDRQSGQRYKKHSRDQKRQHTSYPPFRLVLCPRIMRQQIRTPALFDAGPLIPKS